MNLYVLSTKTKVIGGIAVLLVTFALGRYSVTTAPAIKVSETKQVQTQKDTAKDEHKKTVIVKTPDGTTTTTITDDTSTDTKEVKNSKTSLQESITPPKRNMTNISALVANDFSAGLLKPAYGVSVNRELIGPIAAGAFFLTNGTVGISLGVNF